MIRFGFFLAVCTAIFVGAGCSSDPDTPLGSSFIEDSLILSNPGEVLQDTIFVGPTNTDYEYNSFYTSLLTRPNQMILGRANGFESWMLVRANFSNPGVDTLKTVTSAELTLPADPTSQLNTLGAIFYELGEPFANGDTITQVSLGSVIPDNNGQTDRSMSVFPRTYELPDTLVQRWIRNKGHNGIAIVLNDTTTSIQMTFATQNNTETPFMRVTFSDQSDTTYKFLANGTFTKDQTTTTDLRLSDGDTRRIWLPVDLSSLDRGTMLNQARLVIHMVPGSASETGGTVELYAAADSMVGSSGILTGQTISRAPLSGDVLEFSVRGVVQAFIADSTSNHGFGLKYYPEGNSIRRIDFYGSAAADSVRPYMQFTYTTAPTFPE